MKTLSKRQKAPCAWHLRNPGALRWLHSRAFETPIWEEGKVKKSFKTLPNACGNVKVNAYGNVKVTWRKRWQGTGRELLVIAQDKLVYLTCLTWNSRSRIEKLRSGMKEKVCMYWTRKQSMYALWRVQKSMHWCKGHVHWCKDHVRM